MIVGPGSTASSHPIGDDRAVVSFERVSQIAQGDGDPRVGRHPEHGDDRAHQRVTINPASPPATSPPSLHVASCPASRERR